MRRVFVTGGGHGIGRAIVESFCREGDKVAFCDIDIRRGKETAESTGARFIVADVCDKDTLESAVQSLLDEWDDLDIIVNNVGIGGFEPITSTSVEHFEMILNTNLRSAFITSRLLAIHREKNGAKNPYGRIVNLCSTRYIQSEPGSEGYAASKGGIWSLTHALAVSLAPYHISVNCIAPGWVYTDINQKFDPEFLKEQASSVCVQRIAMPNEIAKVVIFLASEDSKYINGEIIKIDGGKQ